MFGRGRFHAGVVIEPTPEWSVDPNDKVAVAEFRNKIWPTVEEMNKFAPQHSRIFKEVFQPVAELRYVDTYRYFR